MLSATDQEILLCILNSFAYLFDLCLDRVRFIDVFAPINRSFKISFVGFGSKSFTLHAN